MSLLLSCCGFGHREVLENISEKVYEAVLTAADQGCKIFYTGAMGRFDEMFSSSVERSCFLQDVVRKE